MFQKDFKKTLNPMDYPYPSKYQFRVGQTLDQSYYTHFELLTQTVVEWEHLFKQFVNVDKMLSLFHFISLRLF